MRLPIVAAAVFAGLSTIVAASPASAQWWWPEPQRGYEGQWCARMNTGSSRLSEDCHFNSFEACRQEVIAGNRGFCSPNPAYAGPQARRYKKKRNPSR